MSRCLNITRAGEYAIAALARLVLESDAQGVAPVPVLVLAKKQKLPKSFLSKVLIQCCKKGIARSRKGPGGGVMLSRSPENISLLEVLEACEGNYFRETCVFYTQRRCPGLSCEIYCPLRKEEERLRDRLDKVSLAQMAQSLSAHPQNRQGYRG
ncbi:MAG: Rrf2 family transcriptional regulator [Elusimicrobia bacterium]|nr:Rrf2 family transcriptional regulator [Elusimicrobiota bacterium]